MMSESDDGKEVKEQQEEKKSKKKRRIWPWVLLGIFILIAAGGYSFYEYSNTPEFCSSCHIMEPYITAWEESNHAEFGCVDCHISPREGAKWEAKFQGMMQAIKYLTRSYASKPYAEIEDASCLRSGCHQDRLVEEHSTAEFKNHVAFDHRPHLTDERRGKQLRCTSCHAQIVVGNHMEVTTTTCYLCHFRESDKHDVAQLSDCRTCHKLLPDYDVEHEVIDPHDPNVVLDTVTFNHLDYEDKPVDCTSCHAGMIQGKGPARQDRCLVCHNDPVHLQRFDETEFIHDNHITEHNVTCERCHDAIKHNVQPMPTTNEGQCNQCHVEFHNGQRAMYMGTGSRLVEETMPSTMYAAMVDCSGCHMVSEKANTAREAFQGFTKVINYDSCDYCHGDDAEFYVEMFDDSLASTREYFNKIKAMRERLAGSGLTESERTAIDHDLAFIEHSLGWAHNAYYADEILSAIEDMLN